MCLDLANMKGVAHEVQTHICGEVQTIVVAIIGARQDREWSRLKRFHFK